MTALLQRLGILIPLTLTGACTMIPTDPDDLSGYRRTVDDGPGRLSMVARGQAELPRNLPKSRIGNPSSYVVFGKRYHVLDTARGFRERGIASWYGSKFHGRDTSSGEVYNMYNMTAAHKHLPLPTFVQVSNLDNGKSLVVKVTDRGPFVDDRIIDLSYAAAAKLGVLDSGTANVEIVAISENIEPQVASQAVESDTTQPTENPELPRQVTAPSPEQSSSDVTAQQTIVQTLAPAEPVVIRTATKAQVISRQPAVRKVLPATPQPAIREATGTVIQVGAFSSRDNADMMRRRVDLAMQAEAAFVLTDDQGLLHRVQVGPLAGDAPVREILARLQQAGIEKVSIFQR